MSLSAVLLAGGESRRMRCDKATVEWRGRPLWKWQIEKLRAARPEKVFVPARSDPLWRPPDVELILDMPPSRGPLSGLAAPLGSIETGHLLAPAIDLALLTIEHPQPASSRAVSGTGETPRTDGKAEPL